MMSRRLPPSPCLCAAAVMLSGCAAAPPSGTSVHPEVQRIALEATPANAGHVGFAYVVGREGRTDIGVKVSGVTAWVTRPVHLYVYLHEGSCINPSAQPAHALTDRVLTRRDPDGFLTLNLTLPVGMEALRGSEHAIVVRSSPADANMPLFCGDLRAG
jgi:hypothetical protein